MSRKVWSAYCLAAVSCVRYCTCFVCVIARVRQEAIIGYYQILDTNSNIATDNNNADDTSPMIVRRFLTPTAHMPVIYIDKRY